MPNSQGLSAVTKLIVQAYKTDKSYFTEIRNQIFPSYTARRAFFENKKILLGMFPFEDKSPHSRLPKVGMSEEVTFLKSGKVVVSCGIYFSDKK